MDDGRCRQDDFSDEDAQTIIDAGSDSTPDVSPAGLAIVTETAARCASGQDLLNSIIESLPDDVDGDCVRDKLKDADIADIFSSGSLPPEIEQAITECGTG